MSKYTSCENRKHLSVLVTNCTVGIENNDNCKISFKGYRYRKTGPETYISIYHCHTHKVSFTVYPYGYIPFGRKPLFTDSELKDHSGTLFKAAIDASNNTSWRQESSNENTLIDKDNQKTQEIRTLKTQKRHILGASILLMISLSGPDTYKNCPEKIFQKYGLSYLELKSIRAREGPNTYKEGGKHVVDTLALKNLSSYTQLLKLGYQASFFGECHILQREILTEYQ